MEDFEFDTNHQVMDASTSPTTTITTTTIIGWWSKFWDVHQGNNALDVSETDDRRAMSVS